MDCMTQGKEKSGRNYMSLNPLRPIAHVTEHGTQKTHALDEHLSSVAQMAGQMAEWFGAEEWARLAGRWHDLGKYSHDFQKYIRGASGYEAHLVDLAPGRVNHSSAGAILVRDKFGALGMPLAYLIAGHHAGLPDWNGSEDGNKALENRLQTGRMENLLEQAIAAAPEELLEAAPPTLNPSGFGGSAGLHLWIRMLFSCLVDADFLDTEAFMEPDKSGQRTKHPAVAELLEQFNQAMAEKTKDAAPSTVNRLRGNVLRQCREKSAGKPGLYTLTVPTGGGKTLSSLAFSLGHAYKHAKSRIIYAIPYTSIIEQTANVFRDIFGDAVLEHHSNLDAEEQTPESRLAAENWNAPLIVTTNVQLFESLFAARTSRCRKLHNLVNSVIVLDEAQLLPPEFLQPILDGMRLLMEYYGVTFVLCTATQPALGTHKASHGHTLLNGLDGATEIVDETEQLYRNLERVRVHLPADLNQPENWDELASRLQQHESVLAIVNRRADCRELHARMPPGTIHLSALMCGEHRSVVITTIKEKLKNHEPVRVISTQLIEAGVDVDFPVVYRALAGLDSIAQAAGRCNREVKLAGKGNVFVFVPPRQSPLGLLRFGEDACKIILGDSPANPLAPELFRPYFRNYYAKVKKEGLDKYGIKDFLTRGAANCMIQFRSAAEKFKFIDEEASVSILVPYINPGDARRDSRLQLAQLRSGQLHRDLLRQLQRYTVSVPKYAFEQLRRAGEIEEPSPELFVLRNETAYRTDVGLLLSGMGNPKPDGLYVD